MKTARMPSCPGRFSRTYTAALSRGGRARRPRDEPEAATGNRGTARSARLDRAFPDTVGPDQVAVGGNRPDASGSGSVGRRGITARPAALGAAGHGDRQYRNALRGNRPYCHAGWKTSVRSSILSLGNASGGVVGSLNDVCGMKRARPSVMVSQHFNNSASSARISGA